MPAGLPPNVLHHRFSGALVSDLALEGFAHDDEAKILLKSQPQTCAISADGGQFAVYFSPNARKWREMA